MNHQALKQEIHAADQAINNKDFDAVANFYTNEAALVVRPDLLAYGRSDIKEAHKRISEYFNGVEEVAPFFRVCIRFNLFFIFFAHYGLLFDIL